jgi:hypothetical protein
MLKQAYGVGRLVCSPIPEFAVRPLIRPSESPSISDYFKKDFVSVLCLPLPFRKGIGYQEYEQVNIAAAQDAHQAEKSLAVV